MNDLSKICGQELEWVRLEEKIRIWHFKKSKIKVEADLLTDWGTWSATKIFTMAWKTGKNGIFLKGIGMLDLQYQIYPLAILSFTFMTLAIARFKKTS